MRATALTLILAGGLGVTSLQSPVFAHHSLAAEFDTTKRIPLTGILTKVEWTNPHAFFYVDVKDPATGKVLQWACELGSPNMLVTRGWKPDTLKVGMSVSLTGTPARDGSRKVVAKNIIADGNHLTAWPNEQSER